MILILGSPRTGSTLLYQIIINHFRVWYPANDGTFHMADDKPVSYDSRYGKTDKSHEPSEASAMLERWFGKEKTAQKVTELTTILEYHSPWVIKNIWNVWRIDEWVRLFPHVQFVWIRRDTLPAAVSDIRTRKETGQGLNTAYVKFCRFVSCGDPRRDAITMQIGINEVINKQLQGKDFIQIWYHDLCRQTAWEIIRLRKFLNVEYRERDIPKLVPHE